MLGRGLHLDLDLIFHPCRRNLNVEPALVRNIFVMEQHGQVCCGPVRIFSSLSLRVLFVRPPSSLRNGRDVECIRLKQNPKEPTQTPRAL